MPTVHMLDLDEEILSHLPDPEAWLVFRGENFNPILIEDEWVSKIYKWQDNHVREHGKPATASVLADEFVELEFAEPLTAVGDLIDRLRERYMKNEGRDALENIGQAYNTDPLSVPDLLTSEGRKLQSLLSKKGELWGTGDYDRSMYAYERKMAKGKGASLGYDELDNYFYGQHGLTFVIAPPKTYKSWIMIKQAIENASEGKHVWHYSLELPAEESDMRLRCLLANIPWWHYLQDQLTNAEMKHIQEMSEYIDGLGTYHINKPPEGERGIDRLVGTARDAGAEIILIDQLQYVETKSGHSLGGKNDPGEYFEVLNMARNLSDEGPICIAHQFNRSTLHSEGMPDVKQAKGSSAIEETATLALGMWANKDMRRSKQVELGTLISRNYMYASWKMFVDLSHGASFEILGRVEDDA